MDRLLLASKGLPYKLSLSFSLGLSLSLALSLLVSPGEVQAKPALNRSQNAIHSRWDNLPTVQANPDAKRKMQEPAQTTEKEKPGDPPVRLKGKTTRVEFLEPPASTAPPTASVLKQQVDRFQLDAAEAGYKTRLNRNGKDVDALVGLGKVYYYRTATSNQNYRNEQSQLLNQAIQQFKTALLYSPHHREAHLRLGQVLAAQQRDTEAYEEFRWVLTRWPNDREALIHMGLYHNRQQQYNDAVAHLKKATALTGKNFPSQRSSAYTGLGEAYLKLGQENDAHTALMTAIASNRQNAQGWMTLGQLYQQQGNQSAAIQAYQSTLQLRPEHRQAHLALASLYQNMGNTSLALSHLQQANALAESADTLHLEAELAMMSDSPELAASAYQTLLKTNPQDVQARVGLSNSFTQQAEKELLHHTLVSEAKAQHALSQAITTHPENWVARLHQLRVEGQSVYQPTQGDAHLVSGLLRTPARSAGEALVKGEILVANSQFRDAEKSFHHVLNTVHSSEEAITVGEMMMELGQTRVAEKAFERGLLDGDPAIQRAARSGLRKLEAREQEALLAAAEARQLMKKSENRALATLQLENALKLNKQSAQTHWELARLYERQKNWKMAYQHYYEYLELTPASEKRRSTEKKLHRLWEKWHQPS